MKRVITYLFAAFLIFALPAAAFASSGRVDDQAELLTEEEALRLESYLDELSESLDFEVAFITAYYTDGRSSMEYADDYYDALLEQGAFREDGAVLLINMSEREWWISTSGYGITVFSDGDINYIGSGAADYLSDGAYCDAAMHFAQSVEQYVEWCRQYEAAGGDSDQGWYEPGDYPDLYPESVYEKYTFPENLKYFLMYNRQVWLIAAGAGALMAFLITGGWKRKLHTVRAVDNASYYVKVNSMVLSQHSDRFLYKDLSKIPRPRDNGGGHGGISHGGGSSHFSGGGHSHGGGGGHF